MKHNRMRRLLAGVTAAALLAAPALAAEDTAPAPQMPDAWAVGELADSYAMGLVDDNYTTYIQSTITSEQLSAMTGIVADKLALLELPQRAADTEGLVVDTTRGGVMNALYQEAAAYDIDGVEEGAAAFLTGLGVVRGDQAGGLNEDRPCTYQEAMVMAERLILALYDANDAGSRGLLWKAVNGDNTLYLLGTIHMDRSNVYPLHKSVRDALDASQVVSFELDLNDKEGMDLLAAATTKQTVDDYLEMFRRAGMRLRIATPAAAAFQNLVGGNPRALANCCVIDFAHSGTKLHFFADGAYDVTRVIDIGGADIDRAIAAERGVDVHVANGYKLSDYDGVQQGAAAFDVYESIAVEIGRALNFYGFNNPDTNVEMAYCCGGGSSLQPLVNAVASHIDIDLRSISDIMPEASGDNDLRAQCPGAVGATMKAR